LISLQKVYTEAYIYTYAYLNRQILKMCISGLLLQNHNDGREREPREGQALPDDSHDICCGSTMCQALSGEMSWVGTEPGYSWKAGAGTTPRGSLHLTLCACQGCSVWREEFRGAASAWQEHPLNSQGLLDDMGE
jgi:hypothetical protein